MKRQLWWNYEGVPDEGLVKYYFVIINDRREIKTIENRIFGGLAPVNELDRVEGNAEELFYKYLTFESPKKLEIGQLSRFYGKGQKVEIKHKERLGSRKAGLDGVVIFIESELEKEKV